MNKQCTFIKQAERLYNNNVNFKLAKYHITNLYPTFKKELFPTTLDEYFKYSANVERIGLLCRYAGNVTLINQKNEIIQSKSIIFFSEYDINRIIVSHHILIDTTFVKIESFSETLIIMYYDIYTGKMIPGIFICLDNKTFEGYKFIFTIIKYYIISYYKII